MPLLEKSRSANELKENTLMLKRKIERTDLRVSALCLGGNVFGWTCDEPTSFAVLDTFAAVDGNFIDTADVYANWVPGNVGGESETILGRWMQARKNRERMVIATKVGARMAGDPQKEGLSRKYIMQAVEASLRRLQTDYIDLYQAHYDDPGTPLEETLSAFNDLVKQGKARAIGASNYNAQRLAEALRISDKYGYARYVTLQPHYNLLYREEYERELEPLCKRQNIGVIPYHALASGFLTGKYRPGQQLPASPRAERVQRLYLNERGFRILAYVEQVAQAHHATIAQVALAWLLARPGIIAPITSATSVEQTRKLLGALDVRLTAEDLIVLDQISAWR
jgi:aryl-alcohol dehydrogenase-like predicted oxidoreductase